MPDMSRKVKNKNTIQWAAGGIGEAPLANNMPEFKNIILHVDIASGRVHKNTVKEYAQEGYREIKVDG